MISIKNEFKVILFNLLLDIAYLFVVLGKLFESDDILGNVITFPEVWGFVTAL